MFTHTLLFFILITLSGLWLYKWRSQTWLLVLSFGVFTHLLLDQMWSSPSTLPIGLAIILKH
ncbi:metal-dependent hydrolase [Chloroflexota bacterium]